MKFQRTEKTSPLVEKYRAASDERTGPTTQGESTGAQVNYSSPAPPVALCVHPLSRFAFAPVSHGGESGTSPESCMGITSGEVPLTQDQHDQRRDELEIRDSLTDERF